MLLSHLREQTRCFLQFPRPHSVQQWPLFKAKHICPVSTCLNNFSIFIIILSFLEPWAFRCGIASAVSPGKVKVYRSAQIAILSASSLFTFVPMFWLSTKQSNERAGVSSAAIELSIDAMIISGGEVGRGSRRMQITVSLLYGAKNWVLFLALLSSC